MFGVRGPRPPIEEGRGPLTPLAHNRAGAGVKGEASEGKRSEEDGVPEREGDGVLRVKAVF